MYIRNRSFDHDSVPVHLRSDLNLPYFKLPLDMKTTNYACWLNTNLQLSMLHTHINILKIHTTKLITRCGAVGKLSPQLASYLVPQQQRFEMHLGYGTLRDIYQKTVLGVGELSYFFSSAHIQFKTTTKADTTQHSQKRSKGPNTTAVNMGLVSVQQAHLWTKTQSR